MRIGDWHASESTKAGVDLAEYGATEKSSIATAASIPGIPPVSVEPLAGSDHVCKDKNRGKFEFEFEFEFEAKQRHY